MTLSDLSQPKPRVIDEPPLKTEAVPLRKADGVTSDDLVKKEKSYLLYVKILIVLGIGLAVGFGAASFLLFNLIGMVLLVCILVSGAGLGVFISFLANKPRWVWIQRRTGKNAGIAKIFNRGMSAELHIIDLNNDTADIKGNTYKLYSETVRPIPDGGAPTLYYRQGVSEPLHWDEIGHYENNAGITFALLTKVKSLYQSAALAQFGNSLRLLLFVIIGLCVLILVGLYVTYNAVGGVNAGLAQVYGILTKNATTATVVINSTGVH